MNDDRFIDVQNAVFLRNVDKIGVDQAAVIACAVALGIETALAWREDEAARDGWVPPATGEEVITGAHQHRYEKELENQLDTVLRYVEMREGLIAPDDRVLWAEFRDLALEVQLIAEMRKAIIRREGATGAGGV